MSFKRFGFVLGLFLLFVFVISCNFACAVDNDTDISFEISDDLNESVLFESDDDLLTRTYSLNGGEFSDIQNVIKKANSGDTIRLSGKFHATSDSSIIKINKRLTITSSGNAVLDAKGLSGIFYLSKSAKGSVVSNLKFVNGYRDIASAMFIIAEDVTIDNCVFED